MTRQKHLKRRVRERMAKTGERYATARRQVIRQAPRPPSNRTFLHFPGNTPGSAALRILLANAGVTAPHTGEPFDEAMAFGIAGGLGVGIFTFHYEEEGIATFFIAGRHLWQDDLAYLQAAAARLGCQIILRETGGKKTAAKHLREMLAEHGPVAAWVDLAHLPYRAMPAYWSGGGYHIVVVYEIDETAGAALVGDLADEPIEIPLSDLAEARGRIRKQKNRLLALTHQGKSSPLREAVFSGLHACHTGLVQGRTKNFTLDAIQTLADRIHGASGAESWEVIFPPGRKLWTGLTSMHDFIEHYGTGGGLCRPVFAEFLGEAAEALSDDRLADLGERYAALGVAWSELADMALPDEVDLFRDAKALMAEKAELLYSQEEDRVERIRAAWDRLSALGDQAEAAFPMDESEVESLRMRLKAKVRDLYEGEVAAHEQLGQLL
jgi:hypothetical protein